MSGRRTVCELRIRDWSSDVCSSDLQGLGFRVRPHGVAADGDALGRLLCRTAPAVRGVRSVMIAKSRVQATLLNGYRKSIVLAKMVSVTVDHDDLRLLNNK